MRNQWRLWCEKLSLLLLGSLLELLGLLSCSLFWSVCSDCCSVAARDVALIKASGGYISSRSTGSRQQSEPFWIKEVASRVELKFSHRVQVRQSFHWSQSFCHFLIVFFLGGGVDLTVQRSKTTVFHPTADWKRKLQWLFQMIQMKGPKWFSQQKLGSIPNILVPILIPKLNQCQLLYTIVYKR